MPAYTYSARSKAGERTEGTITANDRLNALSQLEQMGLVPINLSESRRKGTAVRKSFFSFESRRGPRMRTRSVLTFTMGLSDLLASGMTLGNALNALATQQTGRGAAAIVPALRDDILKGSSLSQALAQHPRTFSSLFINMVRAGEASGKLTEVLHRLVEHYERIQQTKEKVTMALVYPSIVILLGIATLVVATWVIIPRFAPLFDELEGTLPLSTQILIGIGNWVVHYGLIALAVLVIFIVLANRAVKTERGRVWWHGFLLRVPVVKNIISAGTYANFARTLGTLLINGVPVLQALTIVEQTSGNAIIAREIRNAKDRVTDGTTISGPLASGGIFPGIMTDMIAIGEQTGSVPQALGHVAVRYERLLDRSVQVFTTVLEPILLVLIAAIVGFVAYAMMSAVLSMTSGMGSAT